MTIDGGARETITGGSGGIVFNCAGGGANMITTQAGSTNVLNLFGQDIIDSQGNDTVATTGELSGTVTGNATVNGGSGDNSLVLAGAESFVGYGHDMLTATAGANLTVQASGFCTVSESGATVSYAEEGSSAPVAGVTVSGGSAAIHSDPGTGTQGHDRRRPVHHRRDGGGSTKCAIVVR